MKEKEMKEEMKWIEAEQQDRKLQKLRERIRLKYNKNRKDDSMTEKTLLIATKDELVSLVIVVGTKSLRIEVKEDEFLKQVQPILNEILQKKGLSFYI